MRLLTLGVQWAGDCLLLVSRGAGDFFPLEPGSLSKFSTGVQGVGECSPQGSRGLKSVDPWCLGGLRLFTPGAQGAGDFCGVCPVIKKNTVN